MKSLLLEGKENRKKEGVKNGQIKTFKIKIFSYLIRRRTVYAFVCESVCKTGVMRILYNELKGSLGKYI